MDHYKNYVGAYGKRFYRPFEKQYIFKILDYREKKAQNIHGKPIVIPEFLYDEGDGGHWYDCEDTCIITNEIPVLQIAWVANVNHPDYNKEYFNPFL